MPPCYIYINAYISVVLQQILRYRLWCTTQNIQKKCRATWTWHLPSVLLAAGTTVTSASCSSFSPWPELVLFFFPALRSKERNLQDFVFLSFTFSAPFGCGRVSTVLLVDCCSVQSCKLFTLRVSTVQQQEMCCPMLKVTEIQNRWNVNKCKVMQNEQSESLSGVAF